MIAPQTKEPNTFYSRQRRAGFEVHREFLVHFMLANTDFKQRFPAADHIAVAYDFDKDVFVFKFFDPSLPEVEDGEVLPRIDPPKWKAP